MKKTISAIKAFDNFAVEYQDKFMDLSLYQNPLSLFYKCIKKENAVILDIACGPGNISKYLLSKNSEFRILGIDLSVNMLSLAKKNNPSGEFLSMDCRDISKLDKKFDAIVCGFCLPYLSKTEAIELIDNVALLLNPDGVFYLSTMEDDYNKSGLKEPSSGGEFKMFIHYHQADYLSAAIKNNGFNIIHIERIQDEQQKGTTTNDLIMIAQRLF